MGKRNWKRARATSIRHGIELCVGYAREHQRSVDRVADLMGLSNKWSLYKYMENGRMPANLIRPFEHACGCTYLTDFIGASAQKLVVDIPTGRKVTEVDIAELQRSFSYAVQHLSEFYSGDQDAEQTLASIDEVLRGAAWHRANVAQHAAPELELFGTGDMT
jgi:hypothetical protein